MIFAEIIIQVLEFWALPTGLEVTVTKGETMVFSGQRTTGDKLVRKVCFFSIKFQIYKCSRKARVRGYFQVIPSTENDTVIG